MRRIARCFRSLDPDRVSILLAAVGSSWVLLAASHVRAGELDGLFSPVYQQALRGLGTSIEPTGTEPGYASSAPRDTAVTRVQGVPPTIAPQPLGEPPRRRSSVVTDPPISYEGPSPRSIDDITARDGPHIPEPMVFDLVRGLGARKGELEVNVLNLAPFYRGSKYEWAPEIEYVLFDGFALEFELPIFDSTIQAAKYGAQYTFGTALDDAFIHGVQGILFHEFESGDVTPVMLYLAGMRFNRQWSLFTMFGFSVGPQVFPFPDIPPRRSTDMIFNSTLFYEPSEKLVLGIETNLATRLEGPGDFLFMPQIHYHFTENYTLQFGFGFRDDVVRRYPELGFRVIWER